MEGSKLNPVKIRIKQFQSIEDLEIEVCGLTVVTGRTNIGKSAIMRAISSATLGESVIGLVRKGAQYCSVEMSSKDWGFRWEKGEKGINRYIIGDTTYDKPGQKQLEEIIKMGFGSVKLGSKEVQPWWSPQFFPIFLLGETGPAVTDFISEVSRLTVLQDAVVLSSRGKKRANDNAKEKADEARKIRERLARVSGTDQMIKLCKELEEQKESIDGYQNYIEVGNKLNDKLSSSANRILTLSKINSVRIPKDEAESVATKLREMHTLWGKLEASAKKIITLKPSEKISIPEPPNEEWRHLSNGRRFLSIGGLKEKEKILEGIKDVKISSIQETDEEIASVRTRKTMAAKLLSATKAIQVLSASVEIPDCPDGLEKLRKGQEVSVKLEKARKDGEELDDRMKAVSSSLEDVERQLAAIPSCPSCGRPISSSEHQEQHV